MTPAGPVIRRRSAFADRLLEFRDVVFSDGAELRHRGAWHDFFRARVGPAFDGRVILEIGCNDAALLARVAPKHPATAFVGVDWKCRALHAGAERVAAAGLRNVALLHGRGQDVARTFADGELHEIWLFHPDPCDKPRELRNRLMTEPFLLDVHRVLRPGGSFILKTDHSGYYQWTLALLGVAEPEALNAVRQTNGAAPTGRPRLRAKDLACRADIPAPSKAIRRRFDVSATSADFWNDAAARGRTADKCFAGQATGFESRFMRKRLPIYYAELKKRPPVA